MSEGKILPRVTGRQPSKIKPGEAQEESVLGDALSERDRDLTWKGLMSTVPSSRSRIDTK
jgi:hypothetical protein